MKKSNRNISTSKRTKTSTADVLLAYFDARRDALRSAFKSAQAHYSIEGVHQLRVEVKRLRAFFKLCERITPSFAAKPSAEPLKDLYRAAGILRDIDIFQAVTVAHLDRLDLREYFNHLKSVELQKRKRFDTATAAGVESTLTGSRTKLRSALTVPDEEDISSRMRKRILRLARKLKKDVQRDQTDHDRLHSVRKLSKSLRYTLDVWILCFGKSSTSETAIARLKRTYGSLGEWHDHVEALESLRSFLKDSSGKRMVAPRAYTAFVAHIRKESDRRMQEYEHGRQSLVRALVGLQRSLQQPTGRQLGPTKSRQTRSISG